MKDFIRRTRNKYESAFAVLGDRVRPRHGGELGWLARNEYRLGDAIVPFSYRVGSEGDRGVIQQVFYCRDYSIDHWKQGQALKEYYESKPDNSQFLVIDAGANIGAASVYFSTTYPGSKVVAIEPEKNNCALARLNCAGKNIEIIEGAIGPEPGTMFLQDPGLSDWGFRVGKEGKYEVEVLSVDQILSALGTDTIPFIIKVDIEGGEESLFSGDCHWLDRFALIIVELHDWMLPGSGTSRAFYQQVSSRDFDILQRGENSFCFNNSLLRDWY